ncbi:MAG: ATP-binding protein [Gammaproteobacteria bacterium]|nr:ATP-binding protein [Gammaproteobacteria bacterium]
MRFWSGQRRHSLSGRLVLLFLATAVLVVVLVGGSFGKVFRDHFENNVRPHLVQYIEYVQHDIGTPPDQLRAAELAKRLKVDIYIVSPEGLWSSNGQRLKISELDFEHSFLQDGVEYGFSRNHNEEVFMARTGDTTLYFDIPNLKGERKGNALVPITILLLVLFGLYHLILRLIRPVNILIDGVRRFGHGEIDHRIDLNRRDELGELADSYNEMADDIQQMLDAKRQLLLAISHELRSPLTRAKVSLALMEESSQRQELAKDIGEMESLIEELLESERLTNRHQALNRQPHDLNAVITDLLQQHFADRPIIQKIPSESITMELDGPRIKLLLKNLLENSLRHTPDGAQPPELTVVLQGGSVMMTVKDYGHGIEAEHIPHLTEPFYRADASRHRETGGYGLGLYLCRVIVEAHGGDLAIQSEVEKGTSVIVTLPL